MNDHETFNPEFFEKLKKAEEHYFWFRVRRKWILDRVSKFVSPPAKVLEIGCGTGNVSSHLSKMRYDVTGCELFSEAINMAWPGFNIVQGNSDHLPLKNACFDVVGLFDVIEHLEDDISPLKEASRVVRKDGIVVLTVPAGQELWSWEDKVSLHKRRYSKEGCRNAFTAAGLDPLLIEFMFMSLYMPMKYLRGEEKVHEEPFSINRSVNWLLESLFNLERLASKRLRLPFGTSIIAIARKNAYRS